MPQLMVDADLPPEPSESIAQPDLFTRAVFVVGSAGLLIAAAADALAVLGRHVGFRLLGSIEIVQVAVVMIASAAVVGATLLRAHAAVHLLTSRLLPAAAARLARVTDTLGALALLAVAVGSIWIAGDLWSGSERTELLKLPLRPFRLIWTGAALISSVIFLRKALRRSAS